MGLNPCAAFEEGMGEEELFGLTSPTLPLNPKSYFPEGCIHLRSKMVSSPGV